MQTANHRVFIAGRAGKSAQTPPLETNCKAHFAHPNIIGWARGPLAVSSHVQA